MSKCEFIDEHASIDSSSVNRPCACPDTHTHTSTHMRTCLSGSLWLLNIIAKWLSKVAPSIKHQAPISDAVPEPLLLNEAFKYVNAAAPQQPPVSRPYSGPAPTHQSGGEGGRGRGSFMGL